MRKTTPDKISGIICWILFVAIVAALIFCLISIAGCARLPAGTGADTPLASITARADVIEKTTDETLSRTQAKAIKLDVADAKKIVDSTVNDLKTAGEANTKLAAKWYVRWGKWIERMFWIIGIGWLVAGIGSIVLGLGNPLSLTWRIGKEITRMLPLMNPFSWVRDRLIARRNK